MLNTGNIKEAMLIAEINKKNQDFNHFVVESEVKSVGDKKTLTTVPSGRPRHGKRSDKDKDSAEAAKEEVDEDAEYINGILQELRVELDVKRREEERLQKEIADVLTECASGSSGGEQSRAFGMAVSRLNNAMLVVEADTKQLAASLRTISRLADNISSKVSALDVAKTRVVECLQLAGDMHDLGVCSEEVDQCINNEDYEQAAQHIHRFLTLDRAVFQFSSSADKGIAALLETNQPLIESAYGPDKLLDFINMLQVIDAFEKKRQLEKRLKAAQKILREDKNVDKGERLDALELDTLLSEICLMNTHTEMYWRFVRRRIKGASKEQNQEEYVMVNGDDFGDMDEEKKKRLEEEKIRRKAEREKKLDQLLNRSLVGSKMQELLGNYILLEQYYMEESVRKAIDMDVREEGLLSSVVDDVLFLVRKCVRRATSSGSVDCVCAALNNGVALLETTFYQHLFGAVQDTSCDAYADIVHTLTDSQLAEFEAVDPFIEQFNANLDKQIASFESVLHKENFQTLLLTVCSEVERQMERVIMKCSFNRLGGLQLDREFRQLSAYLSGIAGWTARERCARLAQEGEKNRISRYFHFLVLLTKSEYRNVTISHD
ncbi:hypothetical protein ANCCEY_13625 [Ancylostoma ceylanicum]|uniref:Conserved oligomeric Golgi complex subunit 4 n=1 Tax=Ancylostoma ceylanicum TaxID=53326 RepID=A0A0D6LBU9_9BILA|nr:hypothetical protein ANCCEY_13625 [Ancylostoma ceylanicum]